MSFFSKSKLKIKNQSTKNHAMFCMDYFNLKQSSDFKIKLFKEMLNNCMCLVLIDTNLSYLQTQLEKDEFANKLTALLDTLDVEYKKLTVKSISNGSGLKALINAKNKDKGKDHIVGLVASEKNLEIIKPIMDVYNAHYYIDTLGLSKDEMLEQVQAYYDDEDELLNKFTYDIFDCNSIKNIVIHSKVENTTYINDIVNKLEKDFNN